MVACNKKNFEAWLKFMASFINIKVFALLPHYFLSFFNIISLCMWMKWNGWKKKGEERIFFLHGHVVTCLDDFQGCCINWKCIVHPPIPTTISHPPRPTSHPQMLLFTAALRSCMELDIYANESFPSCVVILQCTMPYMDVHFTLACDIPRGAGGWLLEVVWGKCIYIAHQHKQNIKARMPLCYCDNSCHY